MNIIIEKIRKKGDNGLIITLFISFLIHWTNNFGDFTYFFNVFKRFNQ